MAAVLAAAALTIVGTASSAGAATPCAAATTDRAQNTWITGSVASAGQVNYYRFGTSVSQSALITLGDLHANLALKLYDSSCHLLATSDRGGTTYEQLYRSLIAGRYYLGVSGDSGATSSYDVKFSPLRTGMDVLSYHSYTEFGTFEFVGVALNNTAYPTFFRYVNVNFYNSSGRLVHSDTAGFAQQYVPARARVPFVLESAIPPTYTRVALSVVTEPLQGYPPPPATSISPSPPWRESQGNAHYPGSITNLSTKPLALDSVCVTLYDANGNIRYESEAVIVPDTVMPHQSGGFDAIFPAPTGVNASAYTFV
jgi:hypothetical protein